jgi:hypothetical protein
MQRLRMQLLPPGGGNALPAPLANITMGHGNAFLISPRNSGTVFP